MIEAMRTVSIKNIWRAGVDFIIKKRAFLLVGLLLLVFATSTIFALVCTQQPLTASLVGGKSIQATESLTLSLGQEISPGIVATLSPAVPGTWTEKKSLVGVSALTFVPTNRFEGGSTYTVKLKQMKRVITGAPIADISRTFKVALPPAIKSVNVTADSKNIAIKHRFSATLAETNKNVRRLEARLVPAIPLKLSTTDNRTYFWDPESPLKQGTSYILELDDLNQADPKNRRLASIPFTTVLAPAVASARTGNLFGLDDVADIIFAESMKPNDALIVFDVAGKGTWINDRTYRYDPTGIKPGTTYKYRIKPGLESVAGGVIETELAYEFTTNGPVSASPNTSGISLPLNTAVKFSFDQTVDHASAESKFSINPTAPGSFSWSGNTMIFSPSGLAHQTSYTYAVAAGVTPIFGQPSTRKFSGSFATQAQIIKLGLPAYKTQNWMSCELSGLRMLLAYRGVSVGRDVDVLPKLGYNPRPRDTTTNTWDDPNVMYVGDVEGRPNTTGYGVHAGPIASASKSFGRNATAHFGVSPSFLASQIHNGNPVMFWGHSGPRGKADSWNTSTGVVQTVFPQHARVIFGVEGRADAPIGFHMIDPVTGKSEFWSVAKVLANMNSVPGVSNMAVVVY